MNNNSKTQKNINDNQIADFVVCQYSWKLKNTTENSSINFDERSKKAISQKKQWRETVSSISFLKKQLQVLIFLLVGVVAVMLLTEYKKVLSSVAGLEIDKSSLPAVAGIILVLLVASLFVWNTLKDYIVKEIDKEGIKAKKEFSDQTLTSEIEQENFTSKRFNLECKPDAVIKTGEIRYPVLKLPLTKKIQDRHVAKITAQLLCIEESTGFRPEHGIIILGKNSRRVELKYTDEKREWLIKLIKEIENILAEKKEAKPSPNFYKCKNCDVKDMCEFKKTKN